MNRGQIGPRFSAPTGERESYYGPLLKTFAALEPSSQAALQQDLVSLIGRFNRSGDRTMVVPSEYLEIVITRR